MDATAFATLISNIGFPIACVIAMFYLLEQERKAHKEESDKWTEAVNNNTAVMQRVLDRLDTLTRRTTDLQRGSDDQ